MAYAERGEQQLRLERRRAPLSSLVVRAKGRRMHELGSEVRQDDRDGVRTQPRRVLQLSPVAQNRGNLLESHRELTIHKTRQFRRPDIGRRQPPSRRGNSSRGLICSPHRHLCREQPLLRDRASRVLKLWTLTTLSARAPMPQLRRQAMEGPRKDGYRSWLRPNMPRHIENHPLEPD